MIVVHPIYPAPPKENLLKGIFFTVLAFFFFACYGSVLKLASPEASSIWLNFLSFFVGAIVYLPYVLMQGKGFLKTEHITYHIGRAAFGLAASCLYIIAIGTIPLLNATLLFNTTPIFIPIFSIFMMKSKIDLFTCAAIFVGFVGITFIIHPSVATLARPGDIIGLLSGMCLAIAFIFIKMLGKTDPPMRVVYYFFLLATLMQAPLLPFLKFPQWSDLLVGLGAGCMQCLSQLFIVIGYRYADASKIGVFQYSGVVGIISWLVWGVVPTTNDIIGTIIVAIAGTLIITAPLWSNLSLASKKRHM